MRIFMSLFIVFTFGQTKVSSQTDEAPYIYYHSEALNAIVIERADGSDSRAIARGLMPTDHEFVSGPGWSPSGEWLAWTSAYDTEYYPGPERIWVMSADGERRLTFLDTINDVAYASWSPTWDYLLIVERHQSGSRFVSLIDVAQQRLIASFEDIPVEFGAYPSFWSVDGNSVQFGARIVYVDGRVEDNVPAELREPLAPAPEPRTFPPEAMSPDGRYEVVSDGYIASQIRNRVTDEGVELRPFSGGAGGICDFDWYSDGGWLFITFSMTWAGGGCARAGTSIVSADGRIQRELGPCHIRDRCANWLPEQVAKHLAPGRPASVVPDPILAIEHDGWVRAVGWHSDGIHLATHSENYGDDRLLHGRLDIWDTSEIPPTLTRSFMVEPCADSIFGDCVIVWSRTGTQIGLTGISLTQILDVVVGEVIVESDNYLVGFDVDDDPILVANATDIDYDPVDRLVARADWQEHTIEVNSLDNGKTIYQLELDAEVYRFVSSVAFVPNSQYIAFVGNPDEPVQGNFLWNLITGEIEILPKYAVEYLTDMAAFDSQTIIGYGRGSLLYFWDVGTRNMTARLNRYAMSVDVSADLTRMATGSGYMVEIWDYQTIIDQLAGR